MDLREILLAYEEKAKDKIDPNSQKAFYFQLSGLCNSSALRDLSLATQIKRLGNPQILMPVRGIEGVHACSVYSQNNFANSCYANYVQLKSGLIVPRPVADEVRMEFREYIPKEELRVVSGIDASLDGVVIF